MGHFPKTGPERLGIFGNSGKESPYVCFYGILTKKNAKERESRFPSLSDTEGYPNMANTQQHSAEPNGGFLPMTRREMEELGWDRPDFCLVTGDAYIDHHSFGTAIIARVLESRGYRVAILAQPDWHSTEDFKRFGRPRLGFLVNSGNMDSMVNHYTAGKKPRSTDAYTPGGKAGKRPDRAVIVYVNRIREAYSRMPVIIGGIEASLRRFAHYDYWDDKVRRSVLVDSGADLLLYGMGEKSIVDVADAMDAGIPIREITYVAGSACLMSEPPEDAQVIPSFEEVTRDPEAYCRAFMAQHNEADPIRGRRLAQQNGREYVVVNPPSMPLSTREMDEVYALPYRRAPHPSYREHIPALDEVEFSLVSCRGCYGACNFCALTYHQGRIIQVRSHASILEEARHMIQSPNFKGYIHDVGGPTANFRAPACKKQLERGACAGRQCLFPEKCPNLEISHEDYRQLLKKLRELPGVKKVFVRSGLRYDYIMYDKDNRFFSELVQHHISGQLKVAPEHIVPRVLEKMGKPPRELYERFEQKYADMNRRCGKEQYLVPYLMSSHPGSDMGAAVELACWLKERGIHPEQVQDFYPTPGTLSTTMFYTGLDPRTLEPVYVPRSPREKRMQRALLQWFRPENAKIVREALIIAGREDLIGFGKNCLVRPAHGEADQYGRTAEDLRDRRKQTAKAGGQKKKAACGAERGRGTKNAGERQGKTSTQEGKRPVSAAPKRTGKNTRAENARRRQQEKK